MSREWLTENESVLGDWAVYVGEPSPSSPKTTGRLYVTDRRVVFAAGLQLEENAGAEISRRNRAFCETDGVQSIPFDQVQAAEIVRKKFILKSLQLTLKTGEQAEYQFGAASPARALELINGRIGR